MDNISTLAQLIKDSKHIVFFGGAGVSTASGIPDFRSADGLYNGKELYPPETILSHRFFITHTDIFYDFYRKKMVYTGAKPNQAHIALAKMEKEGKLDAVITQNIDGLHQMAGSKNVLELHGSIYRNHCMNCFQSYDLEYILSSKSVPHCKSCNGIVKPDVVLYEESLDTNVINRTIAYIQRADLLIIGGTSLAVYPAASFVDMCSGKIVLINKSITNKDYIADMVIHSSIDTVLKDTVSLIFK